MTEEKIFKSSQSGALIFFFFFKEVETIRGIKLSLVLFYALVFLFACIPTALGCYIDIKPGSYPNSINVDNNGVVTIGVEDLGISPDTVHLYLYQNGEQINDAVVSSWYEHVDSLVINPYLSVNPIYVGPGYLLKFHTQDLVTDLFTDKNGALHLGDDLYIRVCFDDGTHFFNGGDSIRLLKSNNLN